jgi:hypothetical protein
MAALAQSAREGFGVLDVGDRSRLGQLEGQSGGIDSAFRQGFQ